MKKLGKQAENIKMNKPLYYYPKEYTSISALQSFDKCPFSFYMRYFLKVRTTMPDRVEFGKDFQEILSEKYAKGNPEARLEMINPRKRGLAKLFLMKSHDFENIVRIDEMEEVDVGLEIPFKFAIDLTLEDSIIENKVTGGYYNDKRLKREVQTTLYFLATKILRGVTPKVFYQIFNTKKKSVELIRVQKTPAHVAHFYDWASGVLKRIENAYNNDKWTTDVHGPFPCDFAGICPSFIPKT